MLLYGPLHSRNGKWDVFPELDNCNSCSTRTQVKPENPVQNQYQGHFKYFLKFRVFIRGPEPGATPGTRPETRKSKFRTRNPEKTRSDAHPWSPPPLVSPPPLSFPIHFSRFWAPNNEIRWRRRGFLINSIKNKRSYYFRRQSSEDY